jgi:hypothetical protein
MPRLGGSDKGVASDIQIVAHLENNLTFRQHIQACLDLGSGCLDHFQSVLIRPRQADITPCAPETSHGVGRIAS